MRHTAAPLTKKRKSTQDLELGEREMELFGVVQRVAVQCGAMVWAVGGWVRDTLLGIAAHDVDFAVAGVSPTLFAKKLALELGSRASSVGTVHSNKAAGKHFDTAVLSIDGEWIDIAPLRSAASSIKEQLLQDALDRDYCMNALYYNLESQVVDDPTHRGRDDLATGTLSTPQEPEHTFTYDALRILRGIRLASKLGLSFDMSTTAYITAQPLPLLQAMDVVARERIGQELMQILGLKSGRVRQALEWMEQFNLLWWMIPAHTYSPSISIDAQFAVLLTKATKQDLITPTLLLAALLQPCVGHNAPVKRRPSLASHITVHELKLRRKDAALVDTVHRCCSKALALLMHDTINDKNIPLGHLVRDAGPNMAQCLAYAHTYATYTNTTTHQSASSFLTTVESMGLSEAYRWTPLLSGSTIRDACGVEGPQIREAMQLVLEWRLMDPQIDAASCLARLQTHYGANKA